MKRVESLRNTVIPADVDVAETRNYGATANDKAQKLIQKLLFATDLGGRWLILLGWPRAAIVGAAVILTLTATLFASWGGLHIEPGVAVRADFSIGILVDDAIVVVENIHRHQQLHPAKHSHRSSRRCCRRGGADHPATFTVIAALLPMAFVDRADGPYMARSRSTPAWAC